MLNLLEDGGPAAVTALSNDKYCLSYLPKQLHLGKDCETELDLVLGVWESLSKEVI